MGVHIGHRLKAVALVIIFSTIFLMAFAGTQPKAAEARANLTAYLTTPPVDWEPLGYSVAGTAPYYITHTLGWANTTLMGNVGIGDGAKRTLNNSSNQDVNYTPNNFMAADISMAPWDRGRLTSAPPLYETPAAQNQTNQTKSVAGGAAGAGYPVEAGYSPEVVPAMGNNTSWVSGTENATIRMPFKAGFGDNISLQPGIGGEEAVPKSSGVPKANATPGVFSNLGPNVPLNDVYHPILMGRPVDDLFYEYPLATSVTMYARLVGLCLPCGRPINMGIACLGYGY